MVASAPDPPKASTVRSEASWTFANQVVGLIAGALTNIVFARTLGPTGKGILSLLGYGLFVATSLGAMGLHAASVYMIGKRRFSREDVSAAVALVSLATGAACAAATWALLPRFRGTVPLTPIMIGATAAIVVPQLMRLNLGGILLGVGRIHAYNLSETIPAVAWTLGSFVLLVPLHGDIRAAVLLWACLQLGAALATIGIVFATAPPQRARDLGGCVRACLGFGVQSYVVNLIWILVLRVDGFILAHYRTAAEVGIYSVAVLVAEVVLHLPRSLSLVLTRRFAEGELLPAARMAARAARVGALPVAAGSVVLALVARPLVPFFFGAAFAPSVAPLVWLLPGLIALSIASPLSLYLLQQRGKPLWTGIAAATGLAVDVALNFLWIPRHGAVGAAWASSIAYGLLLVVLVGLFRRETGLGLREVLLPRRDDLRSWFALMPRARP